MKDFVPVTFKANGTIFISRKGKFLFSYELGKMAALENQNLTPPIRDLPLHIEQIADQLIQAQNEFGSLPPLKLKGNWKIVSYSSMEKVEEISQRLNKLDFYSFDTETYGLDGEPINERLGVVQIGIPKLEDGSYVKEKGEAILFFVRQLEAAAERQSVVEQEMTNPLAPLKESLENPDIIKIGQSLGFDRGQMRKFGFYIDGEGEVSENRPFQLTFKGCADTQKLFRDYRPSLPHCRTLAAICVEVLGYSISKAGQNADWSKTKFPDWQKFYAALDVEAAWEAYLELSQNAQKTKVPRGLDTEELTQFVDTRFKEQLDVIRPFSEEHAIALEKIENGKNLIRELFTEEFHRSEEEELEFQSELYGSAYIKRSPVRSFDLEKMYALIPGIASKPEVVSEEASQTTVLAALERQIIGALTPEEDEVLHKRLKAEAKKKRDELFHQTKRSGPSLKINLDLDRHYRTDPSLIPFKTEWTEHSISTPEMAESLAELVSEKDFISIKRVKGATRRNYIGFEIGVQTGSIKELNKGIVLNLPFGVVEEMRDKNTRFFQAIKEKLDPKCPTALVFEKERIKDHLEKYGLVAKNTVKGQRTPSPVKELAQDVKRFVPQLDWEINAITITSASAELLGLAPKEEEPHSEHELLFRLQQKIESLEVRSEAPQPDRELPFDEKIESVLKFILQTEADRTRLIRDIGEQWDIARVSVSNGIEAIQLEMMAERERRLERLREEYQANPGEFEGEPDIKKMEIKVLHGDVSISYKDNKILDAQLLKSAYPGIADEVLEPKVNSKELEYWLRQSHNPRYAKKMLATLMKETGEVTIKSGVHPRYKTIYLADDAG